MNYKDYIFVFETVTDPLSITINEWRSNIIVSILMCLILSSLIQFILFVEMNIYSLIYIYFCYVTLILFSIIIRMLCLKEKSIDVVKAKRPGQCAVFCTGLLFFIDVCIILEQQFPYRLLFYILSFLGILVLATIFFILLIISKSYKLDNYRRLNYQNSIPILIIFFQPVTNYLVWKSDSLMSNDIGLLLALNIFSMIFSLGFPNMLTWIFYSKFDSQNIYEVRKRKQDLLEKDQDI